MESESKVAVTRTVSMEEGLWEKVDGRIEELERTGIISSRSHYFQRLVRLEMEQRLLNEPRPQNMTVRQLADRFAEQRRERSSKAEMPSPQKRGKGHQRKAGLQKDELS